MTQAPVKAEAEARPTHQFLHFKLARKASVMTTGSRDLLNALKDFSDLTRWHQLRTESQH